MRISIRGFPAWSGPDEIKPGDLFVSYETATPSLLLLTDAHPSIVAVLRGGGGHWKQPFPRFERWNRKIAGKLDGEFVVRPRGNAHGNDWLTAQCEIAPGALVISPSGEGWAVVHPGVLTGSGNPTLVSLSTGKTQSQVMGFVFCEWALMHVEGDLENELASYSVAATV